MANVSAGAVAIDCAAGWSCSRAQLVTDATAPSIAVTIAGGSGAVDGAGASSSRTGAGACGELGAVIVGTSCTDGAGALAVGAGGVAGAAGAVNPAGTPAGSVVVAGGGANGDTIGGGGADGANGGGAITGAVTIGASVTGIDTPGTNVGTCTSFPVAPASTEMRRSCRETMPAAA